MVPKAVTVILCTASLITIALAATVGTTADVPGTRSNGERTVTLELLTATWCVGCPYADAAADRLLRVFGPDQLSVIQYHVSPTDPLRIPESDARRSMYGNPALPSLIIDGDLKSEEAHSYEEAYDEYYSHIQAALEVDTPVTLDVSFNLSGGNVTINTSMDSSQSMVGLDLYLRVVLFENILEDAGKIYNYAVRAYNETSVDLVASPTVKSATFSLNPSWIVQNMGAVAFLQTDADGEIHQSFNVMFGSPPVAGVTNPTGGSISGEVTIQGTGTSGRTLSEAFVRIDGGIWMEANGTSSWEYVLDTTTLSDGSHTISAIVYDVAGSYSEEDIVSVTVENEEPVPDVGIVLLLVLIVSSVLALGAVRKLRS